jgi:hypothetical protein
MLLLVALQLSEMTLEKLPPTKLEPVTAWPDQWPAAHGREAILNKL